MHHRRSRTSRREGKRLEDKAYRQAEKRAIDRGVADTPPHDHWGYRTPSLPLGDVPCNGKRHGKKKAAKPKEKCPVNGTHEWYKEESTHEFTYILWNDKTLTWTENVVEYTCIHCWKTKLHRYSSRYHNYRSDRKWSLPKRSVQF
jgi:hypothetical protein